MRLADTNVLIYAVSNRDADASKRTRAEATLKEPDLTLSVQVIQEFYYQATRPQGPAGLTHEQAMEFLRPLMTLPTQRGRHRYDQMANGQAFRLMAGIESQ